jgi:hypothetical protein
VSEQHATSATTGRRSTGMLAAYAVGQLLVVVFGVAIVVAAADDGSGYGIVFGAFLAGIGLVSLLATGLEAVHGRSSHGATLGTAPDGAAVTVLRRAGWVSLVRAAFLTVIAGCLVAGGIVALGSGDTALGVLLLVLGAVFVGLLLPVLLGRLPSGAVYLTASGVTSAKDGAWWRLAWDDIAGVVPEEPTGGARPRRSARDPDPLPQRGHRDAGLPAAGLPRPSRPPPGPGHAGLAGLGILRAGS